MNNTLATAAIALISDVFVQDLRPHLNLIRHRPGRADGVGFVRLSRLERVG